MLLRYPCMLLPVLMLTPVNAGGMEAAHVPSVRVAVVYTKQNIYLQKSIDCFFKRKHLVMRENGDSVRVADCHL